MFNKIVAHTSFLGHTGYANHSREFFTRLNKHIQTKVRNFAHYSDLSYLTKEQKNMIIHQQWAEAPWEVGKPHIEKKSDNILNIILNETNHYFFYDDYIHPTIAYNVWESTEQPNFFFEKLLEFDQLWVPTKWQKECTVKQGYPEEKIKVVPEGVDTNKFFPIQKKKGKNFKFILVGRWDYRKSVTEIIQSFLSTFKNNENVELLLIIDNPFTKDKLTTQERLDKFGFTDDKIKVSGFMEENEYIETLQNSDCLITCARAEGWNLPLIEAMACGVPVICSDYGAQLEFADKHANKVKIKDYRKPKEMFMLEDCPGLWAEPDFDDLKKVIRYVFENYTECKKIARKGATYIKKNFSWEKAIEKALYEIEEFSKIIPEPIRLNLGCGNDIKKDYINIDGYNNTKGVDINCDIRDLPFPDESIKEIYISHTLEHFSKDDVSKLLKEFNKILLMGGWLDIRVPDFDNCVQKWLNNNDKWGALEHIFGGQTHDGNYHFVGFTKETLSKIVAQHGFEVKKIVSEPNSISNDLELILIAQKNKDLKNEKKIIVKNHFVDGPFIDLIGEGQLDYRVEFYDKDNEAMVHSTVLTPNHWTRPYRKYFTNWEVRVKQWGEEIFKHNFNAKGKRVYIHLDSKSLGDTIAWFPYVEKFRKKHKCHIVVSTFWNLFFEKTYPQIEFIHPGQKTDNLYASYNIGCRDNYNENKRKWQTIPLQAVASDYLGLPQKELKPIINIPDTGRRIKGKYVCIGTESTAQLKYWNNSNGWQTIVNYLNNYGYKTVVISKEETKLKNIINKTNKPIKETMSNLKYASAFIGLDSGLSWLSWTMNVPVIMISGITENWNSFQLGRIFIQNKNVCNSCFNNPKYKFDKSDWLYCPKHKGTSRQFECTKEIYPKDVIKAINKTIKVNK